VRFLNQGGVFVRKDANDPVLPAATQGGVAMGLTSLSFFQVPPIDPSGIPRPLRPDTGRFDRRDPETRHTENPKEQNSFSWSKESLTISVQFHFEKQVQTTTGPKFGMNRIDLSFQHEKIESVIDQNHPRFSPENPASSWEELARHFSVENTAERITRFVTNGFSKTSFGAQNGPDSRQKFVDFILPHVREGVDSALTLFGTLPPEVEENAEATYARIQESLEEFAQGKNLV
jgi:hypothetical protein